MARNINTPWWTTFLAVAAVVTSLLSAILSPFFIDAPVAALGALITAYIFVLVALKAWSVPLRFEKWRIPLKGMLFLAATIIAIGWGYIIWWTSQPHFEITAFDTLESDNNAYELTDMLIWNQDNLKQYGVGITFTLEIRPTYFGRQRFGRVIAIISSDEGDSPIEKLLWDDFTKDSSTRQIQLTLPELLHASGLKTNYFPSNNILRPSDLPFQQAKLTIQVAREANRTAPWDNGEITIRNAPWESRSYLVWRDGKRAVDVYFKNLGGAGGFTVAYYLVRLDRPIDPWDQPMTSGTTGIDTWNKPTKLAYLEKGQYFTDTVWLPDQLDPGRYLLEVAPIKKQNFVKFEDTSTTWENVESMKSPWWFQGYGPTGLQRLIFVVPPPEVTDPTIMAELERLRDEQDIKLGTPIQPVEEVASSTGTVGRRQVFQDGEIYVRDGQAYALYGPILEHYKDLGGIQRKELGFPISSIQVVTSSSGITGTMMEFEGPGSPDPSTVIYASKKGVAAIWKWIGRVYSSNNGGHGGWLGFPLADVQYYEDSEAQMFESGYIVYHYPLVNGERDYREPVAYPYLASRGTLVDVQAQQRWQNTGLTVKSGDQITIIQVGGSWTTDPNDTLFDANGEPNGSLGEDFPLTSVVPGTLIGRIGENGSLFRVGRWRTLTSPNEGELYLAMNSNSYEDNTGFITVQITVDR